MAIYVSANRLSLWIFGALVVYKTTELKKLNWTEQQYVISFTLYAP